jgi:hypothetical protein
MHIDDRRHDLLATRPRILLRPTTGYRHEGRCVMDCCDEYADCCDTQCC